MPSYQCRSFLILFSLIIFIFISDALIQMSVLNRKSLLDSAFDYLNSSSSYLIGSNSPDNVQSVVYVKLEGTKLTIVNDNISSNLTTNSNTSTTNFNIMATEEDTPISQLRMSIPEEFIKPSTEMCYWPITTQLLHNTTQ